MSTTSESPLMLIDAAMAVVFLSCGAWLDLVSPELAFVMRARKNSPSACRLVPRHHPAVNCDGMVIPPKFASAWTDTPKGQRRKGPPPGCPTGSP
jgi:hypothetical protein